MFCGLVPLTFLCNQKSRVYLKKKFKKQIKPEEMCIRGKLRPIENPTFWLFWAIPIYIFKHQLLEALLQPAVYLYASFQPIRSLQRDSPWICIWQSQQRIAKTSEFWNFGGEWDGVEQIIDTNYHDGFQIPG